MDCFSTEDLITNSCGPQHQLIVLDRKLFYKSLQLKFLLDEQNNTKSKISKHYYVELQTLEFKY